MVSSGMNTRFRFTCCPCSTVKGRLVAADVVELNQQLGICGMTAIKTVKLAK
jgi:arginase family enzyme